MTILDALYIGIALLLVLLNAFFVLAEFALVKVRATKIEELSGRGDRRALLAKAFVARLDAYLSATQLGITIASLGLGWVGEPAFARVVRALIDLPGMWSSVVSHSLSLAIAFLVITFLHIIVGELAPKSLAIRRPLASALFVAWPMRVFYVLFYAPLAALNWLSNLILKAIGVEPVPPDELAYSQEELRIILGRTQKKGEISFNRLLFFENLIDFGAVRVVDAMVPMEKVRVLEQGAPWESSLGVIREGRYSRYLLLDPGRKEVLGIVHIKDIVLDQGQPSAGADLLRIARPAVKVPSSQPLEVVLDRLQKSRTHMAIVTDPKGKPLGIITMEDILEELVGNIEDEFEKEPRYSLADLIPARGVSLDLQGRRCEDVIPELVKGAARDGLGCDPGKAVRACLDREKVVSTNIGKGIAIPHARLPDLPRPVLLIGRSRDGVRFGPSTLEPVRLVFLLLTPSSQAHAQAKILARIAGIVQSRFIRERLFTAGSPEEVVEIVRSGDPHALS